MADSENIFTVTVDNKDIDLSIRTPDGNDYNEADMVKSRTWYKAVQEGIPTVKQVEETLIKLEIWDDEKQKEVEDIRKEIQDKEYQLTKGNMKISKGRKLALEIKEKRTKIRELVMERSVYYNDSAEGKAENMHFNTLVSRCLVYNDTNSPYFKDLDDYNKNSNTPTAIWAANRLANVIYGIGREAEKGFVENEFLLKFKLVNDDLQLVDDKENLVDEDGNRVDILGNKVNKNGNIIDDNGRPRDEKGRPIVESKPFLDKDGKAIKDEVEKEETEEGEEKTEEKEVDLPESGK